MRDFLRAFLDLKIISIYICACMLCLLNCKRRACRCWPQLMIHSSIIYLLIEISFELVWDTMSPCWWWPLVLKVPRWGIVNEQIRSRINNNDCRMFRPCRLLSTAYKTFCTQLTKAYKVAMSLYDIMKNCLSTDYISQCSYIQKDYATIIWIQCSPNSLLNFLQSRGIFQICGLYRLHKYG